MLLDVAKYLAIALIVGAIVWLAMPAHAARGLPTLIYADCDPASRPRLIRIGPLGLEESIRVGGQVCWVPVTRRTGR